MPPEITQLTNLRALNWSSNCLTELPGSTLAALPNLRILVVKYNELSSLPTELSTMSLTHLNLRCCGIGDRLPGELWEMPVLRCLDIASCGITELPPAVCALQSLQTLSLGNNPLKTLPDELGLLPELKHLFAKGLELSDPDEEVLAQQDQAPLLIAVLRTRARQNLSGRRTKRALPENTEEDSGAAPVPKQARTG